MKRMVARLARWLSSRPAGLQKTTSWQLLLARSNGTLLSGSLFAFGAAAAAGLLAGHVVSWDGLAAAGTHMAGALAAVLLGLAVADRRGPALRSWCAAGSDRRELLVADEPRRLAAHRPRFAAHTLAHDEYAYTARVRNDVVEHVLLRYVPVDPEAVVPRPSGFGRHRYRIEDALVERRSGTELVDCAELRGELEAEAARRESQALAGAQWAQQAEREYRERVREAEGTVRALRPGAG